MIRGQPFSSGAHVLVQSRALFMQVSCVGEVLPELMPGTPGVNGVRFAASSVSVTSFVC
jgi:hypothetical protein